jgi:hypothetical protein
MLCIYLDKKFKTKIIEVFPDNVGLYTFVFEELHFIIGFSRDGVMLVSNYSDIMTDYELLYNDKTMNLNLDLAYFSNSGRIIEVTEFDLSIDNYVSRLKAECYPHLDLNWVGGNLSFRFKTLKLRAADAFTYIFFKGKMMYQRSSTDTVCELEPIRNISQDVILNQYDLQRMLQLCPTGSGYLFFNGVFIVNYAQ